MNDENLGLQFRDLSGACPHSRCQIASYLASSSKTVFLIANVGDALLSLLLLSSRLTIGTLCSSAAVEAVAQAAVLGAVVPTQQQHQQEQPASL